MKTPAPCHTLPLSTDLIRELRSDHAGEAGAVQIYRGILAVSRNEEVRAFAHEHLQTEQRHLAFFEGWLSPKARSHALPLWNTAGWVLGATAALGGSQWVFRTISEVERFVDTHYLDQLNTLDGVPELQDLREVLSSFRDDEIEHRDDAARRAEQASTLLQRCWAWTIATGSATGVWFAKRL